MRIYEASEPMPVSKRGGDLDWPIEEPLKEMCWEGVWEEGCRRMGAAVDTAVAGGAGTVGRSLPHIWEGRLNGEGFDVWITLRICGS